MGVALELAAKAAQLGEVPVGAVVVRNGDGAVIGRGYDARESRNDPTAHAEIIAIRQAAARVGSWRLSGCSLYVTLEPCVMCMGGILSARLDWLIYGAASPKSGAVESVVELAQLPGLNRKVRVKSGVRRDECAAVLAEFFKRLRFGEVSEWSKVRHSKCRVGQTTVGSNPTLSARTDNPDL
jgi:tRNA(adenine34) deaminase